MVFKNTRSLESAGLSAPPSRMEAGISLEGLLTAVLASGCSARL